MAELAAGVEGRDERGGRPKPPRTECPAHLRSGTGFPARVRVRRIRGLDSRRHCGLCHHPAHSLRPQLRQARAHLGRDFAAGQARPLDFPKTIRHERVGLARRVNGDGQNQRHARGDAHRALGGKFPLEAEVAFVPRLGVRRDERDKEPALLIGLRIFASHSSPSSRPPSASNHASTPAPRCGSQIRRAASASCEAWLRNTAREGDDDSAEMGGTGRDSRAPGAAVKRLWAATAGHCLARPALAASPSCRCAAERTAATACRQAAARPPRKSFR